MSEQTFTVTFRSVGPVTRTTVGEGKLDPEEEALGDVLHWIWSWHLQVGRLHESTLRVTGTGTPLESRKASSRTSYEEHMLSVARRVGWHLFGVVTPCSLFVEWAGTYLGGHLFGGEFRMIGDTWHLTPGFPAFAIRSSLPGC
jgi:hypothetical protein